MDHRMHSLLEEVRPHLDADRFGQLHYLAEHDPPLCLMELVELQGAGILPAGDRRLVELRARM